MRVAASKPPVNVRLPTARRVESTARVMSLPVVPAVSAVRAMGRTASSSWLEYIYEQLEVEDPFFRLEAVLAIAEIADESSIDSLSILFEDEDAEIAETAVETVSLIGGEIAVSTLMEFLERADEKWTPVLEDAIKTASGQMGDTPFSSAGSI